LEASLDIKFAFAVSNCLLCNEHQVLKDDVVVGLCQVESVGLLRTLLVEDFSEALEVLVCRDLLHVDVEVANAVGVHGLDQEPEPHWPNGVALYYYILETGGELESMRDAEDRLLLYEVEGDVQVLNGLRLGEELSHSGDGRLLVVVSHSEEVVIHVDLLDVPAKDQTFDDLLAHVASDVVPVHLQDFESAVIR
jgi:hypothetical protein